MGTAISIRKDNNQLTGLQATNQSTIGCYCFNYNRHDARCYGYIKRCSYQEDPVQTGHFSVFLQQTTHQPCHTCSCSARTRHQLFMLMILIPSLNLLIKCIIIISVQLKRAKIQYHIGGIFHGEKISRFRHRKQNIYMVHTLFLTDLRNFNPRKYTPIRYMQHDPSNKFPIVLQPLEVLRVVWQPQHICYISIQIISS